MKRALLLVVLLLVGCVKTHRYEYFDFESANVPVGEAEISVSLKGDWVERGGIPKTTWRSSPYLLVVEFASQDPVGEPVEIELASFRQGESPAQSISMRIVSRLEENKWRKDGKNSAFASVHGLRLQHEVINIEGVVRYRGNDRPFSIALQPKYSSEFRNDFMDNMMSV